MKRIQMEEVYELPGSNIHHHFYRFCLLDCRRRRGPIFEEEITFVVARGQFHQHFTHSFYAHRSLKRKKEVRSSSFLRFWDLCMPKLCVNTLVKLILAWRFRTPWHAACNAGPFNMGKMRKSQRTSPLPPPLPIQN